MQAQNKPPFDQDWEDRLAQLIGDGLAFQVGYRARKLNTKLQHYSNEFKHTSSQVLTEYIHYELDLLPSKPETQHFAEQVKSLEDDVDRLAERIKVLFKRQRPSA